IYDTCRTPESIERAFEALRKELEDSISDRMRETERQLLEHFDSAIIERLRVHKQRAIDQLDRVSRMFWRLSRHVLQGRAVFDDRKLSFALERPPLPSVPAGEYALIRKGAQQSERAHVYRLTHPLGEFVLDAGRQFETPL